VRVDEQPYQVKRCADGFTRLYAELQGVRGFFLRADRQEWLVAVRAVDYLKLLRTQGATGEG